MTFVSYFQWLWRLRDLGESVQPVIVQRLFTQLPVDLKKIDAAFHNEVSSILVLFSGKMLTFFVQISQVRKLEKKSWISWIFKALKKLTLANPIFRWPTSHLTCSHLLFSYKELWRGRGLARRRRSAQFWGSPFHLITNEVTHFKFTAK